MIDKPIPLLELSIQEIEYFTLIFKLALLGNLLILSLSLGDGQTSQTFLEQFPNPLNLLILEPIDALVQVFNPYFVHMWPGEEVNRSFKNAK